MRTPDEDAIFHRPLDFSVFLLRKHGWIDREIATLFGRHRSYIHAIRGYLASRIAREDVRRVVCRWLYHWWNTHEERRL